MSLAAAVEYLRCPPNARWRWDEGGNVLVWEDGTTLAFRAEIDIILERFVPHGFPPFSSLLYLLAAVRGRTDLLDNPTAAPPDRHQLLLVLEARRDRQVREKLAIFSRLPPALLAKPAGKAVLAEVVFEHTGRLSPDESRRIFDGLAYTWDQAVLNEPLVDSAPFRADKTAAALAAATERFTADTLLLRLRTGIDALPESGPALGIPDELRVRHLLDALERDETTSSFARIVRDLTAAIRLPRALTDPDDLPLGGASDIGNRGALDRLLLSELAHDDLTLATRVALNEALYLRREPPTHRPERALMLLLDAGVRMWGVPRVVATAVALSLTVHHRGTGVVSAWRAKGRQLIPVELLDKAALETHLAALETDLNPLPALPRFIAEAADRGAADLVVVTHRDVLDDVDFHARLAQADLERGFLVLVDRDGSVELHRLPWGAQRPLAQAKIDPARLFPPRQQVDARTTAAVEDYPAIFRLKPFPLRMPLPGKFEAEAHGGHGNVGVTNDHRLLTWEGTSVGARQLATDLPDGRTVWLMRHVDGRVFLLQGRGGDGRVSVVIASAGGESVQCVKFAGPPKPRAGWFSSGLLYVALNSRVVCVDPATTEVRAEVPMPAGITHLSGRYYRSDEGLRFASWSGTTVVWDKVTSGSTLPLDEIVTAFDREGLGAWIVTRRGKILGPTGAEIFNSNFGIVAAQEFRDGNIVTLLEAKTNRWHTVDLASRRILGTDATSEPKLQTLRIASKWTLQTRFTAVGGGRNEPVRLRTNKGRWLEIFAVHNGRSFQLTEAPAAPRDIRAFSLISTSAALGCGLRRATWPGGGEAWLDSRGWLHLRVRDRTVPEVSIALSYNAALAVWCSDGTVVAPSFFTGSDANTDYPAVAANLQKITEALC